MHQKSGSADFRSFAGVFGLVRFSQLQSLNPVSKTGGPSQFCAFDDPILQGSWAFRVPRSFEAVLEFPKIMGTLFWGPYNKA